MHWDFSVKYENIFSTEALLYGIFRFDDIKNKEFNQMMIKNVQAVVEKHGNGTIFNAVTVKRMFHKLKCFPCVSTL